MCRAQSYVDQEWIDTFDADNKIVICRECKVPVSIDLMPEETPEALTIENLDRIVIRVQSNDLTGWTTISARDASDMQFEVWAQSRLDVRGSDGSWSLEERADFCDVLWRDGHLNLMDKDAIEETYDENN